MTPIRVIVLALRLVCSTPPEGFSHSVPHFQAEAMCRSLGPNFFVIPSRLLFVPFRLALLWSPFRYFISQTYSPPCRRGLTRLWNLSLGLSSWGCLAFFYYVPPLYLSVNVVFLRSPLDDACSALTERPQRVSSVAF